MTTTRLIPIAMLPPLPVSMKKEEEEAVLDMKEKEKIENLKKRKRLAEEKPTGAEKRFVLIVHRQRHQHSTMFHKRRHSHKIDNHGNPPPH